MQIPDLKIEGRSGCPIRVHMHNGILQVIKTSSETAYNTRLKEQAEKQRKFTDPYIRNAGFFAPDVIEFNDSNELYWFSMQYINGLKYSSFLTTQSKQVIDRVISMFRIYFEHLFKQSVLIDPPSEVIYGKLATLRTGVIRKTNSAVFIDALNRLEAIPQHQLYAGPCHGDFTLSNMLFLSTGRICVFDLLDSFIETPLMDWVKLKQDTSFKWSIHVENEEANNYTKLLQVLNYMDHELTGFFAGDEVIRQWQNYLQLFNLMRIIPYAKDDRDMIYLENTIQKLI